jgi:two-component system OmpR family response regulator
MQSQPLPIDAFSGTMMTNVMMVEDSPIVRGVLRGMLETIPQLSLSGGFSGAPAAIDAIRNAPPDVILLDIQLKVGNGMDVLKVVSAEYPAIKVIVVTNFSDAVYRKHYSSAGAFAFFDKCHELRALSGCLEKLACRA